MSLKDYFEMGRENERRIREKHAVRTVTKVKRRPSPYSIDGIIMGAGSLYEILHPYITRTQEVAGPVAKKHLSPMLQVIQYDVMKVWYRIRGQDQKWEDYQRFLELARGKE
jgi:hypothetical protein